MGVSGTDSVVGKESRVEERMASSTLGLCGLPESEKEFVLYGEERKPVLEIRRGENTRSGKQQVRKTIFFTAFSMDWRDGESRKPGSCR